jgi:hypothetical protein
MHTEGLRLEQAPPLAVPLRFFFTAPFGIAAAGALLIHFGSALLVTPLASATAAWTHLGTLGFISCVMLGALYQMIPVVAGAPVPTVRSAYLVHLLFVGGVSGLVVGLLTASAGLLTVGAAALALALALFILPVSLALWRAPTKSPTVVGMTVACAGLTAVLCLGLTMALVRSGHGAAASYPLWTQLHLAFGFIVWIGGLIVAVSFQVVPMFYLAPALDQRFQRLLLTLVFATFCLLCIVLATSAGPAGVALAATPGALAIWFLHPLLMLDRLRKRRRKRVDPSLWFWKAGLACGLAAGTLGAAALALDDPRYALGFGWLVLWGWAGNIVHGMLTRIVPFLVWFHRFSSLVGLVAVPAMRKLLPERLCKLSFCAHAASLVLGLAAILTANALLARLTGVGVAAAGVLLFSELLATIRHRTPTRPGGTSMRAPRPLRSE